MNIKCPDRKCADHNEVGLNAQHSRVSPYRVSTKSPKQNSLMVFPRHSRQVSENSNRCN